MNELRKNFETDPKELKSLDHMNNQPKALDKIICCEREIDIDYKLLGATSIEKTPKISASGRNFLDPLPPSSKKGPTDENVDISYLIVIIKFGFFRVSNPSPLFHQKAEPHRFYQLRWPLTVSKNEK